MALLHLNTGLLASCIVLVLLSNHFGAQVLWHKSCLYWFIKETSTSGDWSFGIDKNFHYYSFNLYRFELRIWKLCKYEIEEEPICPCGDDRCQDKALCMLTPA